MEWQHNFGAKTLQRGRALQGQGGVFSLSVDREILMVEAVVEGSYEPEYEVQIELEPVSDQRVELESFCTCPVGRECKHAAAAMFEFMERYQPSMVKAEETVSLPGQEWLSAVADAAKSPVVQMSLPAKKQEAFLVFVLQLDPGAPRFPVSVQFCEVRWLKSGGWGKPKPAVQDFSLLVSKEYLSDVDRQLLMDLFLLRPTANFRQVAVNSEAAICWLEHVIQTGRCCWMEAQENRVLSLGESRFAEPGWRVADSGIQIPSLIVQNGEECVVLPFEAPCYVDDASMRFGRLGFSVPVPVAREWLNGIPVKPQDVPAVQKAMKQLLPDGMAVRGPMEIQSRTIRSAPVPCMTFHTTTSSGWVPHYYQNGAQDAIHAVNLEFIYDDIRVEAADSHQEIRKWDGTELVCIERDLKAEEQIFSVLHNFGFKTVRKTNYWISRDDPIAEWLTLPEEVHFLRFLAEVAPQLKQQGWLIVCDPSFELNLIEPEAWYVDLEEQSSGIDWFNAALGVVIDGQKQNLLPVLLDFIRQTSPAALSRKLEMDVLLTLPDGKLINIPAERMRMLASTLLELFSKEPLSKKGTLSIPWIRAMELLRIDEVQGWESRLPNVLKGNLERFKQLADLTPVSLPEQFTAKLRPYQHHGLSWLQFLREMNLGAVLADDMGLGKTVQALAHIQLEKEAGRMKNPCLIVSPTSVLHNWESETRRFAPSLRVHVSHGPERKDFFDSFGDYDLIVTSYPLLVRDGKQFTEHPFHLVILDEAQFVRNHKTQAARIVRLMKASQRIALTGTPLENNLDELWALFSFVVPGLLGENALFRKLFRIPIEKGGNDAARHLLAQRIAPFMLRRTKDEVIHELPPKTEIVQRVDLHPEQKDLYETVRISVEKKVRQSIEEKGVARSHIIVLDALLKMRQVCCHPQLLKLKAAEHVTGSAKLDALREMVVEMAAEGRRILLFSQFVSMINLIEQMLDEEKIKYVKITGQTRDRKTPVETFQEGKVPVFLISLKAGGTGLNLTAADTVIHFDPWWNPAVENQATDRAYRIGQDKPVFVYKLIAAGTVEEKIIELQERKSELINGLLNEQKDVLKKWDEADLEAFFSPLDKEGIS